jgi:hypothetical protein
MGYGFPGSVWTGSENLAPAGIRLLDLPARIESLYRLSYPHYQSGFGNLIGGFIKNCLCHVDQIDVRRTGLNNRVCDKIGINVAKARYEVTNKCVEAVV